MKVSDFEVGSLAKVVDLPEDYSGRSKLIGQQGVVLEDDSSRYVRVDIADGVEDYYLFLPDELEIVEDDGLEEGQIDAERYGIRIRRNDNCFEFFSKDDDKVLLLTEFVSLDTLIHIAVDHKEGKR